MSFMAGRGQNGVRIVHIRHNKRQTDVIKKTEQNDHWAVLIIANGVEQIIPLFPAGRSIAPNVAVKPCLHGRESTKKGYSKASGQDIKKQKRRKQAQKICVYCLRTFMSNTSTNVCSDYCRVEQKKLTQCISDINRGYKRNYDKYIKRRNEYRNSDKKHSFF